VQFDNFYKKIMYLSILFKNRNVFVLTLKHSQVHTES